MHLHFNIAICILLSETYFEVCKENVKCQKVVQIAIITESPPMAVDTFQIIQISSLGYF